MKAYFETIRYEAAHGKKPRGTGNWAFCPNDTYAADNYLDHVVWASGTYSEAKATVSRQYPGVSYWTVCS